MSLNLNTSKQTLPVHFFCVAVGAYVRPAVGGWRSHVQRSCVLCGAAVGPTISILDYFALPFFFRARCGFAGWVSTAAHPAGCCSDLVGHGHLDKFVVKPPANLLLVRRSPSYLPCFVLFCFFSLRTTKGAPTCFLGVDLDREA